jgi:hypothetical protein
MELTEKVLSIVRDQSQTLTCPPAKFCGIHSGGYEVTTYTDDVVANCKGGYLPWTKIVILANV